MLKRLVVGAFCVSILLIGDIPAHAGSDADSVVASFEGQEISLASGWGEANACHSDDLGTRCYRTESEMDTAENLSGLQPQAVLANCSTSLRLYRSTSYGGGVLSLTQRGIAIALAPLGFDNDTSSYKVGACSSIFYDGAAGSAVYPGPTGAGASATSMLAGWNNRVSTVYIN